MLDIIVIMSGASGFQEICKKMTVFYQNMTITTQACLSPVLGDVRLAEMPKKLI